MKERPIIFSGEMVRAILDGRKTMTRRVVPAFPFSEDWKQWNCRPEWERRDCPLGSPGDRLWVRETWARLSSPIYRADAAKDDSEERDGWWIDSDRKGNEEFIPGTIRWRSSIFMPRRASRITLEITAVWVERLRDISADDVQAEGIDVVAKLPVFISPKKSMEAMLALSQTIAHGLFKPLWDSLNAKRGYGWDENPWVWVISFRRLP